MATVHSITPTIAAIGSSPSPSPYMTTKREVFTVWMKSLIMQGNGCTVFDQNGTIIYRIDNYDKKCGGKVFLMDLRGKVLFTILQRRKLRVLGHWEGFKCCDTYTEDEKLWFRAEKACAIFGRKLLCRVSVHSYKAQRCYNIEGMAGEPEFTITNREGDIIGEAKRKQSSSGAYLGNDVLALTVEPEVDHSLIMALVTVYGSMSRRM